MNTLLEKMGAMLTENYYLGIVFAFLAGVITIFSPCSLSNIPLVVSYTGGLNAGRKKAFIYSLLICAGQTVTFTVLGIIAALFGKLMDIGGLDIAWHIILALLMLIMALELWEITHLLAHIKGSNLMTKIKKKGALGAFLVGITGGLFCIPCTTPILAAILAYVSSTGKGILQGAILLISYSIGHGLLLITAGTSVGIINQMSEFERLNKAYHTVKIIFGVLVFLLGIYLLLDALL